MSAPARQPGPGVRRAGADDVRPHRRRLRPDEHGDDGRPAPPLARARGRPRRARARRPRPRRLLRHRRPGARARGAGSARRARWSAATSPSRCSSWRAARPRASVGAGSLRVGRRARAALRGRVTSTRSRSASGFATSPTSSGAGRDGAGAASRRAPGDPRDHPAAAPAAVDLLLAVVRPPRARCSGAAGRRPRRLHATCPSR